MLNHSINLPLHNNDIQGSIAVQLRHLGWKKHLIDCSINLAPTYTIKTWSLMLWQWDLSTRHCWVIPIIKKTDPYRRPWRRLHTSLSVDHLDHFTWPSSPSCTSTLMTWHLSDVKKAQNKMIDPNNLSCAFFPFRKGTYFLVKDTVINGSHSPISREPFTLSIDRFTPLVTEMSLSSTKIDSYRSGLGDGGEREPCVCLKIAQLRGLPRTLPSFFSRRVFVRIPSLDCLALFFCFSMLLEAISSNQPFSSVIRNAS